MMKFDLEKQIQRALRKREEKKREDNNLLSNYFEGRLHAFTECQALTKELEANKKVIAELKESFILIALNWNELPDKLRYEKDLEGLAKSIKDFPF